MPMRYPSPAIPSTCSAEILEAKSDMPMNGQLRSRPARKYSLPERPLLAARVTAKTTSPRLAKITKVSTHDSTMFHSSLQSGERATEFQHKQICIVNAKMKGTER